MVPIFFGMVGFAVWLRAWEGRLTERILPDYVRAGWFRPPEVAALGSLGRRHAARDVGPAGRRRRRAARDARLPVRRDPAGAAARRDAARPGPQAGRSGSAPCGRSGSCWTRSRRTGPFFVGRDPQTPAGVWDGERYHLRFPDGTPAGGRRPGLAGGADPGGAGPTAAPRLPGRLRPARLVRPPAGRPVAARPALTGELRSRPTGRSRRRGGSAGASADPPRPGACGCGRAADGEGNLHSAECLRLLRKPATPDESVEYATTRP